MKSGDVSRLRSLEAAAGAGAILVAAFVTNSGLEQAFGRTPHSLSWGPTLFRILIALHGLVLLVVAQTIGFRRLHAPGQATKGDGLPYSWFILGALTLIAVLLRIPSLNSCLWLDEVLTMARFAKPPFAWIFTSFPDQNQHMLYSLLAHGALRVFGEQAWSLRLPSVLFGAASLGALFLLGRKIASD